MTDHAAHNCCICWGALAPSLIGAAYPAGAIAAQVIVGYRVAAAYVVWQRHGFTALLASIAAAIASRTE
jgi:hypothetical protein